MADLIASLTAPNKIEIKLSTGLFINNEFVKSSSGRKIVSINPADESEIASVEAASVTDVDLAVKAARTAFDASEWRSISGTDRGLKMLMLADLIQEHKETLATIESWDNGKPYGVALHEDIEEVITTLRYYAGWADKLHGLTIPTTQQKFAYTLRQPVGVCGQIIPWNYDGSLEAKPCASLRKYDRPEAFRTDSSVYSVPSLVDPKSWISPGVINIINGYGEEAGHAIVSHPDVDKIAFTGSTLTGRAIMKTASLTMKNITLETGGKSPLLVFQDADLEQAAKWSNVGIMSNQGQICTATSRILVHEAVFNDFVDRFTKIVQENKIGDPFVDDTFQGPQITKSQYEKILRYIEVGKEEGAKLVIGGVPYKSSGEGKGFFIKPTIFTRVNESMKIFHEEVFGPFVVITTFRGELEAVRLANSTSYGLGAAVFTRDVERAHRVASRLEAGMVWINSSNDSDIRIPFGGVKQSGIGRELGEAGLAAYLQTKAVHVNMGLLL